MIAPPFLAVPPLRYGGTELVVAALADGLVRRGHTVTLYASGDSSAGSTVRSHYPHAVWPPDPMREVVQATAAAWDLLERDEHDLIHTHCAAALAFAPLFRVPVIYTMHHAREDGVCDLLQLAARAPLTTVAISRRQRALLGAIPAEVIHHGLDPARYPLGKGGGGYAAFLGRFAREKGVSVALDAAARAEVPLRLAGRPHPPDAQYYRDEVAPRMVGPGVRWFGEVGLEGKVRLLGEACATLFPATWEEPFGLVLVESMLCGTPVVAFPRGSVPELVEEGVTGFVVNDTAEMAERLRGLASGRVRFDRARCRAATVARFGVQRMVSDYLTLYRSVLARASALADVP